jgi:hypothetical protein
MISPMDEMSVITLRFTEFKTQASNDIVQVFECTDIMCSQQQQLAELSGISVAQNYIMSTTGFMKVVFTSDGSISNSGFNASWSLVRPSAKLQQGKLSCL